MPLYDLTILQWNPEKSANEIRSSPITTTHHSEPCLFCLMYCCWFHLSVQEVGVFCISPLFLLVTTLTIPLCSALLFLLLSFPPPLLGMFCRLSPSFVSGCALTAIKRLPFMRNRSKDKDKAKAIYRRSMCKIAVSRHANRHCLHSRSSYQYGDIWKEKSQISAVTVWDCGYFSFLPQHLLSG